MRFRLFLFFIYLLLVFQPMLACDKIVRLNLYAKSGTDITEVLQGLVNKYNTIVIDEGEWFLSGNIQLRSGVTIKGVDSEKSIIKRLGTLQPGMMFYTEKTNTDSYTQQNVADDFSRKRIKYIKNRVDEVFWKVSCVGVNSTDCIVRGNIVAATSDNISCLTLGHEPVHFRADNAVVENNVFHLKGARSVLIQNGCNILLKGNDCLSVIEKNSSR